MCMQVYEQNRILIKDLKKYFFKEISKGDNPSFTQNCTFLERFNFNYLKFHTQANYKGDIFQFGIFFL